MATIDLSRSSTDFRKHFTGVRAQMGRVFTDDDHNENERLHGEDERATRIDVIGPDGSPDDGFKIQNPAIVNGKIDFDITPGTFYLGGNRLTLESTEKFQAQSDWLNMTAADMPDDPGISPRFDLVYLETWQQPVSAVEDNELFEVALGKADTGTRMRQMRRVHAFAGTKVGDCHEDWLTLTASWTAAGLGTINAQDELAVDTTLTVGFAAGSNPKDLCSPPVGGGYLGAENQAIRVQIVDSGHFTWGFDNAAPPYRVTVGTDKGGNLRKITMITEPKDQAHWPVAEQIVEILPWSAVLANGEKIAEMIGFLARVGTSYDPDSKELFLTVDVPAKFGEDWLNRPDAKSLQPEFFYMRVWDRGPDTLSPPAIPFGKAVPLGDTGLNVTFNGNDHRAMDYWIIAARPESPNRVVPWLLEAGRGPHGVHRYFTVLAVIQWTPGAGGKVIHDCREIFLPLTRLRGCCTHVVGDGTHSFGKFTSIQAAIDALPLEGGCVCLLPGVFQENFHIAGRHDVSVHGCGVHTIVRDKSGKAPVITIQDSQGIEIRNFQIESPVVTAIQLISTAAAEAKQAGLQDISLDSLKILARDVSAIDCRGGRFIRIRWNDIEAQELAVTFTPGATAGTLPLVFVRADDVTIELNRITAPAVRRLVMAAGGVQIGGGSERVEIRRNRIESGNGNGITLGSISYTFKLAAPGGGFEFFPILPLFPFLVDLNGCLNPDPDPKEPTDPDGHPIIPVSDGDLQDIRILENYIFEMGLNGISTLRYFKNNIVIKVRDLDVEGNRIRRCVRLELGGNPFGTATPVGYGGISLTNAELFVLRNNWIERNGRSYIDPVCGVFLQTVRGFIAENNVIRDNGPRVETAQQPTAGPRGGVVIQSALAPLDENPKNPGAVVGYPVAQLTGNTVIAPLGRALSLVGRGLMSIEGNAFTSNGVERDGNFQGVTVLIVNLGLTYEIGQFLGFSNLGKGQPGGVASDITMGGEVLFSANQVLLASLDTTDDVIASSIAIWTADDVLLSGNQCECRVVQQDVLIDGLVLAWSTRTVNNRFEERLVSFGVSALTIAAMNNTTNNQGTRCIIAAGIKAVTVRTPNTSLVTWTSASGQDPCGPVAAAVSLALRPTGLEA